MAFWAGNLLSIDGSQLVALIQQRIRHVYRRQQTTLFPSCTAKSRNQLQLGVDGLDVAHARTLGRPPGASTSHRSTLLIVFVLEMVSSRK
jgi:hypothetical protein